MAEGVGFPFPSLPLNEGRTYGQPEVVLISLPQVATGLRLRLPGSFRRRGFQPDLLMPQILSVYALFFGGLEQSPVLELLHIFILSNTSVRYKKHNKIHCI